MLAATFAASLLPYAMTQGACLPLGPTPTLHALLTNVEGHVPRSEEVGRTQAASDLLVLLQDEGTLDDAVAAAARLYGVAPPHLGADVATRNAALQAWLTSLAARVSAHGVLLRDGESGAILAAGTYSISPLLERLRVVPLDPSLAYAERDAILDQLATCFVEVDTWIEIPTTVIEALLGEHDEAYIYLAVTTIDGEDDARWVPARRLVDVVTFDHVATRDAASFSAWFIGAGVSPFRLARLLPAIRSNATPRRLLDLITSIVR